VNPLQGDSRVQPDRAVKLLPHSGLVRGSEGPGGAFSAFP
jgi:hypothetical protein